MPAVCTDGGDGGLLSLGHFPSGTGHIYFDDWSSHTGVDGLGVNFILR